MRVILIATLILCCSALGQTRPQKKKPVKSHAENLSLSPVIARIGFDLYKRIDEAAMSDEDSYQIETALLKAVDEELDRLSEFDARTSGDVKFIQMMNNGKSMASKYLDDRHERKPGLDADLAVIDCVYDMRNAISDRRFNGNGHCISPYEKASQQ